MYSSVSSPSSLSLDPNSDVVPEADAAPEYDYVPDYQTLAAELSGKHPPFEHTDIAYSSLSYACIRSYCYCCYPIFAA